MWSFCRARLKRVFCRSITSRISAISPFWNGQAIVLLIFFIPSTGLIFFSKRSNAVLNCLIGPFGPPSDLNVDDQVSSCCVWLAWYSRTYSMLLTLHISRRSLWRSSGAPLTRLRYWMTVPVSCSTATILAEMLNGSISIQVPDSGDSSFGRSSSWTD